MTKSTIVRKDNPWGGGVITAWSYSRWSVYDKCPAQAGYKFVLKLKEPSNAAMDRGNTIHTEAEGWIKGWSGKLPASLSKLEVEYRELRSKKALAECEWAFTSTWEATSWFGKDAWCRIKVDAVVPPVGDHLKLVDHKSGADRTELYIEQLGLYAIGGFLSYPQVNTIEPQFYYVDHGITRGTEEPYYRHELPAMQRDWMKRVAPMLNDTRFAPKPGRHCTYCHFSKAKGGPCKF